MRDLSGTAASDPAGGMGYELMRQQLHALIDGDRAGIEKLLTVLMDHGRK